MTQDNYRALWGHHIRRLKVGNKLSVVTLNDDSFCAGICEACNEQASKKEGNVFHIKKDLLLS
jgi:hypothetical protein